MSSFRTRLLLLFLFALALLGWIGWEIDATARRLLAATTTTSDLAGQRDTIVALVSALRAAQSAQRAYLLTEQPQDLADYNIAVREVDLARARVALQSNAKATANLLPLATERIAHLARTLTMRATDGPGPTLQTLRQRHGFAAMEAVEAEAARLMEGIDARLADQASLRDHRAREMRAMTPTGLGLCVALLALAFWMTWREQAQRRAAEAGLRSAADDLQQAVSDANRSAEHLGALSAFAELLQSCHTLEEALGSVAPSFQRLLPGVAGRLALINASQNLVAVGAHWGQHTMDAESIFAPNECWALRRGQPHPPADSPGGFVCKHVHVAERMGQDAAYLCLPLAAQGGVVGVLTLDFARPLLPSERKLALASTDHLALAVANLKLQQDLRTQSIRDPLTGLFNRRYLEASLERDIARAVRRNGTAAVLMVDVDHFKRFNDTFGHDAGDHVLAAFGKMIAGRLRAEDTAARYGGEEFTAVLVECDAACAIERAESLRKATEEMNLTLKSKSLGVVTISVGVACFPEHGDTAAALVAAADAALYESKRAGRNRVTLVGS